MELENTLYKFVEEATKNFDDSHNIVHATKVWNNAQEILKTYPPSSHDIFELIMIICYLHDVRDHKYPDSISKDKFESFIKELRENDYNEIIEVIENISFSKQDKKLTKTFNGKWKHILDIVRDADRLEAIGQVGIERCKIFTETNKPKDAHPFYVQEKIVEHCMEKLLRLYGEMDNCGNGIFIITKKGREMALPLHLEIEKYVNENIHIFPELEKKWNIYPYKHQL